MYDTDCKKSFSIITGLPQIEKLVVSTTNTTATLQWDLPYYPEDTTTFKV